MKHVGLYEQFVNEEFIFDKINNEPLFNQQEKMSASDFLKRIKNSPEAKQALKSNLNFGKGIKAVKFLKKALPVRLEVSVYRSEWNYGGNLVLSISVVGMGTATYKDAPLSYSSGDSTRGPGYSVGHYFEGLPNPNGGNPIEKYVTYGTYKAISKHDEMLEDIVKIFAEYEKKHGAPFNPREAKKIAKKRAAIEKQFNTLSDKVSKDYYAMKDVARKLGIDTRQPTLVMKHGEVRMKIDEPRQYRHPDEYGSDATMSKEYTKFEKLQSKIIDALQKFADKHGLELSVAADWSY
jgi:hypothetical protein